MDTAEENNKDAFYGEANALISRIPGLGANHAGLANSKSIQSAFLDLEAPFNSFRWYRLLNVIRPAPSTRKIAVDAMLQSLFVILYMMIPAIASSLICAKKPKMESSSSASAEKKERPSRKFAPALQPKRIALTRKEVLIKGGLRAGRHAYPTLDDIKSDWSEKEEKNKGKSDELAKKGSKDDKEKEGDAKAKPMEQKYGDMKQKEEEEHDGAKERVEQDKKVIVGSGSADSKQSKESEKQQEKVGEENNSSNVPNDGHVEKRLREEKKGSNEKEENDKKDVKTKS
ncbi:hypothetical protein RB195_010733 [Necator americanus]|uniref:Uncharacterized protein n=1 Tax=Necator americanus TaxID=51031 RepID=A0ABR1D1J3_NECAM